MIVVDTSIIGYLYLTSPHSLQSERALQVDPHWVAPVLWRSELQNVLAMYLRKHILSLNDAQEIFSAAVGLMAGREYTVPTQPILRLVAKNACSAYTCEFVALAHDLQIPLVTINRQILSLFPRTAISLDTFAVAR